MRRPQQRSKVYGKYNAKPIRVSGSQTVVGPTTHLCEKNNCSYCEYMANLESGLLNDITSDFKMFGVLI